MENEITKVKCRCNCNATSGGFYGLAFIGALIFYLQQSSTFWDVVLSILKALVWPAMLIYKLLQFLPK